MRLRLGFQESKLVLKGHGLKTSRDYRLFIEKHPTLNLAKNPEAKFHDTGEWNGWDDYLQTGFTNPKRIRKMSYDKARKLVKDLGIKSSREYFELKKLGTLPYTLPTTPKTTYKKDWKGWHIFLDINPTTQHRAWVSYEKCKEWAINNKIKTQAQWDIIKKPINIPSDPARVYK